MTREFLMTCSRETLEHIAFQLLREDMEYINVPDEMLLDETQAQTTDELIDFIDNDFSNFLA